MTAFSQGRIDWPTPGDGGPDSSYSPPPYSAGLPPETVNASARAPAREYHPDSGQSQPDRPVNADDVPGSAAGDWWADLASFVTPPDVWSADRPSLSKVWAYASRGEWTAEDGLPRLLGKLDAIFIVMPLTWLLYQLQWIIERPARRAAAALLLVLLAQLGPLHALLT